MKYIFLIFLLYANFAHSSPLTWNWKFVKVTDGDTVEFNATNLPSKISKVKIRIYGIDTPESTAAALCDKEKVMGKQAKEFVINIVNNAKTIRIIDIQGWDKYGGRILADIDIDGKSLRKILLENKLAREYYGDAKGNYWCS